MQQLLWRVLAYARWRMADRQVPVGDARTHHMSGLALHAYRRHGDAIAEFQEAIRLQPDYADAHFSLGRVYWELGLWLECAREWQETLRLAPGHVEALAWFHRAQGKLPSL